MPWSYNDIGKALHPGQCPMCGTYRAGARIGELMTREAELLRVNAILAHDLEAALWALRFFCKDKQNREWGSGQ